MQGRISVQRSAATTTNQLGNMLNDSGAECRSFIVVQRFVATRFVESCDRVGQRRFRRDQEFRVRMVLDTYGTWKRSWWLWTRMESVHFADVDRSWKLERSSEQSRLFIPRVSKSLLPSYIRINKAETRTVSMTSIIFFFFSVELIWFLIISSTLITLLSQTQRWFRLITIIYRSSRSPRGSQNSLAFKELKLRN